MDHMAITPLSPFSFPKEQRQCAVIAEAGCQKIEGLGYELTSPYRAAAALSLNFFSVFFPQAEPAAYYDLDLINIPASTEYHFNRTSWPSARDKLLLRKAYRKSPTPRPRNPRQQHRSRRRKLKAQQRRALPKQSRLSRDHMIVFCMDSLLQYTAATRSTSLIPSFSMRTLPPSDVSPFHPHQRQLLGKDKRFFSPLAARTSESMSIIFQRIHQA